MGRIGEMIAAAGAMSPAYAQRLLADIPAAKFARFARVGGVEIRSNHPAFIVGHLSLYPRIVLEHLGVPAGAAEHPPAWHELFRHGVECRDDAGGTIYPPMRELIEFFTAAHAAALDGLKQAGDEALLAANSVGGRMGELFPLLGGMLMFYVSGHPQIHLGQLSAWRRAMGLPPA